MLDAVNSSEWDQFFFTVGHSRANDDNIVNDIIFSAIISNDITSNAIISNDIMCNACEINFNLKMEI